MANETSGQGDSPLIPPGTPRWIVPALAVTFTVAALIQFVIAATSSSSTVVTILLLTGGVTSLVLALQMVRALRRTAKQVKD